VPTDHWAYDAVAELAAKGLIEGYPDGAFRGDRAMTRYEMAMVVARLLARIEAIKIPPLPADLVRQGALNTTLNARTAANTAALRAVDQRLTAKLAVIQRLVAEFRAELAALGVRVTAVEEELAAIRARMDRTRVMGDMRYRANWFPTGSPSISGTNLGMPDYRMRARLTFVGSMGPQTEAVVRLTANNRAGGAGNTTDVGFGGTGNFGSVSFDRLYVDLKNKYYANLWRLGRQPITVAAYGPGPTGLLYDPANSAGLGASSGYYCTTGVSPVCATTGTSDASDGLRTDWTLGPINLMIGLFRETAHPASPQGAVTPHRDYRVVRATTGALIPGWTFGAQYLDQRLLALCCGLVPPTGQWAGRGWGVDVNGTVIPGVLRMYGEWVGWTARADVGMAGTLFTWNQSTAWRLGGNLNMASWLPMWSPNLDFAYMNYTSGGCSAAAIAAGCFNVLGIGAPPPVHSYAGTVFNGLPGGLPIWDMRGWLARLNLTFSPATSAFIHYEGGNRVSTGVSYTEWWLRATHTISPGLTGYVQWTKGTLGGADFFNFYRAELGYSW